MVNPSQKKSIAFYDQRLLFERTVSKISSRFVMLTESLGDSIHLSLQEMGEITGASRTYIFQFREDLAYMDNTYEWCAPSVTPEIDNLQGLPTDMFPWWMDKLKKNEFIIIPDVSAMPEEAGAEKEILESQDIKAVLVLPINTRGKLIGYIGFDNVVSNEQWEENDLILLRITSEIFGSAFERLSFETELRRKNQELAENLVEIKNLQSMLIQQEKMIGIGQLAAGIAHEINNPLGYVRSNHDILHKYFYQIQDVILNLASIQQEIENDLPPDTIKVLLTQFREVFKKNNISRIMADIPELMADSKIGFNRINDIIISLRNFARDDTHETFRFEDLHQIINEILIILNNEVKPLGNVDCRFGDIPNIPCHRGQIGQVLINLIMNSIHAIKEAGDIHRGVLVIHTYTEESHVCIELIDNGSGIREDIISQIFNPFFTTKEIGDGTGLGLSISYDIIVNKHRGNIKVNSQVGIGTTFTIQLPIS